MSEGITTILSDDANLTGYWRINETSGTNVTDYGASGLTGTASRTQILGGAAGKYGTCGTFVAASSDKITIGDYGDFAGSFSISAWIKTNTVATGYIVSKGTTGDYQYALNTNVTTGYAQFVLWQSAGASYESAIGTKSVCDNAWHHIVGVFNATTTTAKIWVDGVLEGYDNTASGTRDVSGAANLIIGGRHDGSGYFDGYIDDVMIFGRALTTAEVATLYQNFQIHQAKNGLVAGYSKFVNGAEQNASVELNDFPLIKNDTNLKAYYRFESGALTTDSSGNTNTLTDISDPAETTGKFGGGVSFDGNDGYSRADDTDFEPTGAFTVGGWIKTGVTAGFGSVFGNYTQGGSKASGWWFFTQITSGVIKLRVAKNTGVVENTDYRDVEGFTNVCDNSWHFVVGVNDGTYLYVYVDGGNDARITTAGIQPVYAATTYLRIACMDIGAGNAYWFTGDMDELFLLKGTALTAEQVAELYNRQVKYHNGL